MPEGEIHLLHGLPGRVRVKVDGLKHNEAMGEDLVRRLSSLQGILNVQPNPATGNLLISYDPDALEVLAFSPQVARALGKKGEESGEGENQTSTVFQEQIKALETELRQAQAHILTLEEKKQKEQKVHKQVESSPEEKGRRLPPQMDHEKSPVKPKGKKGKRSQ